jgi:competence protein ComEC
MFGARLLRRSYDLLSSLSFAAIVVTAIWPTELTSAGFLLSFGAVLGVAIAKEVEYRLVELHEGKRPWWCVFLFGGMIQCITLPVSLWFFYEL